MQGLIGKIFNIKTGFHGTIISQFAKLNLNSAVDEENDELLQPWGELLNDAKITRPGPINPYLEQELVKDCDLSLSGALFKETTGFTYEVPRVTEEGLREMVESYERLGWWPGMEITRKEESKR
jgi:hypothetical protein